MHTGCLTEMCPVTSPVQEVSDVCVKQKSQDIALARQWYQLTVAGEKQTIRFPLLSIPWLNQTMEHVQYKTLIDPFESRWLGLISVLKHAIQEITAAVAVKFARSSFFTIDEYKAVYHAFNQGIQVICVPPFSCKFYMSGWPTNSNEKQCNHKKIAGQISFFSVLLPTTEKSF